MSDSKWLTGAFRAALEAVAKPTDRAAAALSLPGV
jgi:hypothetical protein